MADVQAFREVIRLGERALDAQRDEQRAAPDLSRVILAARAGLTEDSLFGSVALALPAFVAENEGSMARVKRVLAAALLACAAGVIVLLATILFMLGGLIHG